MSKDLSIEYAHIYTNNHIGDEQKLSLEILSSVTKEHAGKNISLVVMVDDYSFPDPSFDYATFTEWLRGQGFQPDIVLRESQLMPSCDEVLHLIGADRLKNQIGDYVRAKKYPCSLFVAAWYLLRLGHIKNPIFPNESASKQLINILPISFKPFEDKAFEIIKATPFAAAVDQIENRYFEGRLVA
ncbi:MAG: hypothetical protein JWO73_214 [Candidatus Taylorbacteria bacterium]|nr:hypothetical protein [Candidatus Taylorbacteria bacterium]